MSDIWAEDVNHVAWRNFSILELTLMFSDNMKARYSNISVDGPVFTAQFHVEKVTSLTTGPHVDVYIDVFHVGSTTLAPTPLL